MADTRMDLVCRHCGGRFSLAKGFFGKYHTVYTDLRKRLDEFLEEHEAGRCSGDIDCSNEARNHFVILEDGETLDDVAIQSGWICVEKMLPDESGFFLVNMVNHFGLGFVTMTHYTKTGGWGLSDVTHWMPPPKHPNRKGGE